MQFRDPSTCAYDALALGEVMLRLDPGDARIRTARSFTPWEGGGEYNVVRGLRRVFGLRTGILTALTDNEVGHLIESLILAGGVNTDLIVWDAFDGVGRFSRNGLNFTERGFGVRGALGVSDRGHTAMAKLSPERLNLEQVFGERGVRWLHTGGICAGLSDQAAETVLATVRAAKEAGTIVSYDLNYRPSLWQNRGGQQRAIEVNRSIAPYVDVMIGNEEDFTAALGFEVAGADEHLSTLEVDSFAAMIDEVAATFDNFQVIATTLRGVHSASDNDWGALAWSRDTGLVQATPRPRLEIFDRVGGGDSFASGLAYGLLSGASLKEAVELGAAHGALAMTTPGDTTMATKAEVEKLAMGGSARVVR